MRRVRPVRLFVGTERGCCSLSRESNFLSPLLLSPTYVAIIISPAKKCCPRGITVQQQREGEQLTEENPILLGHNNKEGVETFLSFSLRPHHDGINSAITRMNREEKRIERESWRM